MTLIVLRSTGQILCRMSLKLGFLCFGFFFFPIVNRLELWVFETEHFEHYNILTLEIIFFPPHLLNFILHYFSLLLLAVGFSGLFSIAVTFLNYFSKAFIFC